jgi:hypothetical protein
MLAFIKCFLLHYGIYRRYPLGRFPPCAMRGAPLSPDAMRLSRRLFEKHHLNRIA